MSGNRGEYAAESQPLEPAHLLLRNVNSMSGDISSSRRVGGVMLGDRVRVVDVTRFGIVLKKPLGGRFTVAYGEILTAERLRNLSGICLHTRGLPFVRVRVRGRAVVELEGMLRERGVRIVDCWGAIITPTLVDFERALAEGPGAVRQSSDNA